jgi:hypothetical protein
MTSLDEKSGEQKTAETNGIETASEGSADAERVVGPVEDGKVTFKTKLAIFVRPEPQDRCCLATMIENGIKKTCNNLEQSKIN